VAARRKKVMEMGFDGEEFYIALDGVRIAKRGEPGTRHAKTWIPLEPGYRVFDHDENSVRIEYDPPTAV
jgi:hypothetical protein